MPYDLYPAVDPTYNFPPEVRGALAKSLDLRNTVIPMTTTQRNNLVGIDLWDGRLILNTTTDRINRYDLGTTTWYAIAEFSEITTLTNVVAAKTGLRNAIRNGDQAIAQRGAGPFTANVIYTLDGLDKVHSGGTHTVTQENAPIGLEMGQNGSKKFYRSVVAAQAAIGDYAWTMHRIEDVRTFASEMMNYLFSISF